MLSLLRGHELDVASIAGFRWREYPVPQGIHSPRYLKQAHMNYAGKTARRPGCKFAVRLRGGIHAKKSCRRTLTSAAPFCVAMTVEEAMGTSSDE